MRFSLRTLLVAFVLGPPTVFVLYQGYNTAVNFLVGSMPIAPPD